MPLMFQVEGISTRAVAIKLNVHFFTISRLQRRPCVTKPVQDLHIRPFHLQDRLRQPPRQLKKLWVCTSKDFLHKLSETISGKLICVFVVFTMVLTLLQFGVVTDFSGKILTFYGHWHAGEVCSSQKNPSFNCTGQMALCGRAVC